MMQQSLDDILFLLRVSKFNQGLDDLNQLLKKYKNKVEYISNNNGEFYIIRNTSKSNCSADYFKSFKLFSEKLRLIFE